MITSVVSSRCLLNRLLSPCPPFSTSPSRYLQEVGYTDTILDVKSQRVRALLGLTGDSGEKPSEKKTEPMVNGTEPSSLKDSGMIRYRIRQFSFTLIILLGYEAL